MAQAGKSGSKRGKTSYFMAILGVSLVLLLTGIFGWLMLSAKKYSVVLAEEIEVQVYFRNMASQAKMDEMTQFIKAQPYSKDVRFVDKETAKKNYIGSGETNFDKVLDTINPLPNSVEFKVRSGYVQKDSLAKIQTQLLAGNEMSIDEVKFPEKLVEKMGPFIKWTLGILIGLSVLFAVFAIVLIDNTIKLSMYSNRFLIKTMQMVGATRAFIAKPINTRAVINGAIAAGVAIGVLFGLIKLCEALYPPLKQIQDIPNLLILFTCMMVAGILITWISTQRSVVKYLKMKLDDLY